MVEDSLGLCYNTNNIKDKVKKIKIYCDTSIVSYLQQEDAPDKMATTMKLWHILKQSHYEIYLSNMTLFEVNKCSDFKRLYLNKKLKEIEYTLINIDDKCLDLAREIITTGILTEKSFVDC